MANLKIFVGSNFVLEGYQDVPSEDYIKRASVFYDERNNFLTYNLDRSSWDWYYNYLDFVQILATQNPRAKPIWLLDLGYVPIVYLPSCCTSEGTKLVRILDEKKLKYVRLQPYSFVNNYNNLMTSDIWMSKMDVAPLLGVEPHQVTSAEILRRLVLNA